MNRRTNRLYHPSRSARALIVVALLSAVVAVTALPSASAGAGAPVTLPDLKIFVPTNLISIGTDPGSGHRDLRFTHITADVGTGPFEIDPNYNSNTGTSTFRQEIYSSPSPGQWVPDYSVPVASTGVWEPPSDYRFPMTKFTLDKVNANGSPGAVVATSPKTDYCITGDYVVTGVPNTPNQTFIPQSNCGDPTQPLGWSVGWADEYDQTDAGQPIDLSGIPDGTYILHAVVDPLGVLTESNKHNNVTDTELRISGNSVTVLSQTNPAGTPPTIRLTSPSAGAHVSGTVMLSASAAASAPATVAAVQFVLDGQPLGPRLTHVPYTYGWTVGSTTPGSHLLSARVTDSYGTVATAASVPVVVVRASTGGQPPPPSGGKPGHQVLTVRSLRWRHGLLTVLIGTLPKGARLSVELKFKHRRPRFLIAKGRRLRVRTIRPAAIVLRVLLGGRQLGRTVTTSLGRPPTIRITNPARGEVVSGTIPLVADARDNVAISSVQFAVDGKRVGRPVRTPPFVVHWRTTRVKSGRHRISAVALDPSGNTARATVVVRVQNPAPPMTCFVLQAHVNAHGHGTATTAPLHTATAGETLLAFVSADGPAGAGQQSATVSGAGLTWKLVERANRSSGDSEIWAATTHRILKDAQITSSLASANFDESLSVIAMEGARGVGSVAAASAPTGAPQVDLRTRSATSLVFAVGNDWNRAVARALPVGWVSLDQDLNTSTGDTFWSQYTNQPTGRAGSRVVVKVVRPTNDQWNLAAVELVNSDN